MQKQNILLNVLRHQMQQVLQTITSLSVLEIYHCNKLIYRKREHDKYYQDQY